MYMRKRCCNIAWIVFDLYKNQWIVWFCFKITNTMLQWMSKFRDWMWNAEMILMVYDLCFPGISVFCFVMTFAKFCRPSSSGRQQTQCKEDVKLIPCLPFNRMHMWLSTYNFIPKVNRIQSIRSICHSNLSLKAWIWRKGLFHCWILDFGTLTSNSLI